MVFTKQNSAIQIKLLPISNPILEPKIEQLEDQLNKLRLEIANEEVERVCPEKENLKPLFLDCEGYNVSLSDGHLMLHWKNIDSDEEPCQFENCANGRIRFRLAGAYEILLSIRHTQLSNYAPGFLLEQQNATGVSTKSWDVDRDNTVSTLERVISTSADEEMWVWSRCRIEIRPKTILTVIPLE